MTDPHEFEDECTWYTYKVTARVDATGEKSEQYWMGRDANHALERAAQQPNGVMIPFPDTAKAERIFSDG